MRFGIAIKTKKLIDEGKIKANYTLIFKDNEEIRVRKIGQNSNYFFYLQEGEKIITVTPIVDNIKQIKRIKKE
jgi:hypothetical protein